MTIRNSRVAFVCFLLLLLLSACTETKTRAPAGLVADLFVDIQASPQSGPDPDVVRERSVAVNLETIYELSDGDAMLAKAGDRRLKIPLFSDVSVEMVIERIEAPTRENVVITGRIVGDEASHATLVAKDGILVGHISYLEKRYEIKFLEAGVQSVREIDQLVPDTCGSSAMPEPEDEAAATDATEGFKVMATGGVIDILVTYTPSALKAAGSISALEAGIQMAIADTNTALTESRVTGYSVRLVAVAPVTQSESGDWSADIASLRSTSDGRWDEVHRLRTQYGADQVSMIVGGGGSIAGVGYVGGGKAAAFTIVRYSAFRNQTFAHELGHNLSLQHEDGLEVRGKFRTVMAYGSAQRIPRFSNPDVLYDGVPTGDATHNAAAKILRTIASVTNYLGAGATPAPTPTPTTPAPAPTPTTPAPAPPPPAPAPPMAGMISGFTLITSTGASITITNGGTVTIARGTPFTVIAEATDEVSRVRFTVQEQVRRGSYSSTRRSSSIDSQAPFYSFGQSSSGSINGRAASNGSYSITATPITADATGKPVTISFRMVVN